MIKINLSRKLGEMRWSQAVLARVTGIRPSTINDLFHEMTDRVSLVHLDKICEALDCDLFDILEYIPNSELQEGKAAEASKEKSRKTGRHPKGPKSHPGSKV